MSATTAAVLEDLAYFLDDAAKRLRGEATWSWDGGGRVGLAVIREVGDVLADYRQELQVLAQIEG